MEFAITLTAMFQVAAILLMFGTRRRTRDQNTRMRRALQLWLTMEVLPWQRK